MSNDADELFMRARAIPDPEERSAYLRAACLQNAALLARVENLLADEPSAKAYFAAASSESDDENETLLSESTPTRVDQSAGFEDTGALIGRYKLLEKLGEGGFGSVWAAEQKEPVRRRVALKIIKLGMDTKQVVARFEAERQALALMDHPNIAKVLDAGATNPSETSSSGREPAQTSTKKSQSRLTSAVTIGFGRPYFVMELVNTTFGVFTFGASKAAGRKEECVGVSIIQTVHLRRIERATPSSAARMFGFNSFNALIAS